MSILKRVLAGFKGCVGTAWTRSIVNEDDRGYTDSRKLDVKGPLAWEDSPMVPKDQYHSFTNLCDKYIEFNLETGRMGEKITERSGFAVKHVTLRHGSNYEPAIGDCFAHQTIAMSYGSEVPRESEGKDFNWLPTTGGHVLHCHALAGGIGLGGNEHWYNDNGHADVRIVHRHISLNRNADPYSDTQHRYLKTYVGGLDVDSYGDFGADYGVKLSGKFCTGLDLTGLMNPPDGTVAAMVVGSGVPVYLNGSPGEPVTGWKKDQTMPPTPEEYGGASIRYQRSMGSFILTNEKAQDTIRFQVEREPGIFFKINGNWRQML